MTRLITACFALALLLVAGCSTGGTGPGKKPVRLEITNPALPAGVIGVPYAAQLNAVGGEAPYQFGTIDPLPPGLVLDASTGVVSGTPTALFNADITFSVTDSYPATVTRVLNLQVTQPPALNLAANLGPAFVGAAFSGSANASGGVAPYTYFIQSGALPGGLSLDPSSGAISGTPAAAGSFPFTMGVTDLAQQQQFLAVTIDVSQGVALYTSGQLPEAFDGHPWYARIDALGGLPPYQFNLIGAPAWVQATTQGDGWLELTGTAAGTGTAAFTVQVTDSVGAMIQAPYTVDVGVALSGFGNNVQVVTTALPHGVVDEYYEVDVHASAGFAPYFWRANGLPGGLYFDATVASPGRLRGRPHTAGVYTVELIAEDGVNGASSSTIELVVEPRLDPLPDAAVGTAYSAQAGVHTGGPVAGMQLVSAGSANGLDCIVASGVQLMGLPAYAARSAYALQVTIAGRDFIRLVGMDVAAAPASLQVKTTQLPAAVAGSAYDYHALLQAEGGSGQGFQWALVGGTLPPGILWQNVSGPAPAQLGGTATQTGSFSFTVEVTDSAQNTAQANLTIDVVAPRKGDVNGDGCPDLVIGSEFSGTNGGLKLFYGEPTQPRYGWISMEDADWTYAGSTDVCRLADLNGDGVSDIILNQRAVQSTPARIKIWYGSRTNPPRGTAAAPDCEIIDSTATDRLGSAIDAGDLDGDGYDDLVVGARLADINKTDAGAVYIFYGGPSVLTGTLAVGSADAVLTSNVAGTMNSYWGYPATGYLGDSLVVQDIDGDGKADIAAGASSEVFVLYSKSARHAGTLNVRTIADAQFGGLYGSVLSERIALGDFDGDTRTDILFGGLHSYLFYGGAGAYPLMGASDAGSSGVEIEMPWLSSTSLYVGVEALDLNDDGIDDFAFALPENAMGLVFYGSTTRFAGVVPYASADVTLNFGGNDYAPWFVVKIDANNDGTDDLMVGIHNWTAQTVSGPVYTAGGTAVINGSSTNPPTGSITPAGSNGLKFIGQLSNHGWGGCAAGG